MTTCTTETLKVPICNKKRKRKNYTLVGNHVEFKSHFKEFLKMLNLEILTLVRRTCNWNCFDSQQDFKNRQGICIFCSGDKKIKFCFVRCFRKRHFLWLKGIFKSKTVMGTQKQILIDSIYVRNPYALGITR